MKKLSIMLVILILAMSTLVACDVTGGDSITIYNWEDYIYLPDDEGEGDDFEADFKAYYLDKTGKDIDINYVTFDTNETMLTRMFRGDSTVDVMCPSEYAIEQLLLKDLLLPINYFDADSQYADNSQYVNMDLVDKVNETFAGLSVGGQTVDIADYMVPYMWGTIGVLYNVDEAEKAGLTAEEVEASGWGALFNVDAEGNKLSNAFDGKILMKDSIRDAYAATVCHLYDTLQLEEGYYDMDATQLINTVDDTLLAKVEETLVAQRAVLSGYEVDFGKDDLINGVAYVDLAWSGDAMYAIEEAEAEGVELAYYVPDTSNIWLDGWVIPRTATNVDQAKIFIDFLNDPMIASKNMMYIGYTSAVDQDVLTADSDVMQYMTDMYEYDTITEFQEYFFKDTAHIRYPAVDTDKLGMMKHFGDSTDDVTAMWETVKAQGLSPWVLIVIIVGGLLAVGIVVAVLMMVKSKKSRRRRVIKK